MFKNKIVKNDLLLSSEECCGVDDPLLPPWLADSGVCGGAGDGSGFGAGLIPVGVVDVFSNNPLSKF